MLGPVLVRTMPLSEVTVVVVVVVAEPETCKAIVLLVWDLPSDACAVDAAVTVLTAAELSSPTLCVYKSGSSVTACSFASSARRLYTIKPAYTSFAASMLPYQRPLSDISSDSMRGGNCVTTYRISALRSTVLPPSCSCARALSRGSSHRNKTTPSSPGSRRCVCTRMPDPPGAQKRRAQQAPRALCHSHAGV